MKIFFSPTPSSVRASSQSETDEVFRFHKSLPGYRPTPLISLDNMAKALGVRQLFIKDEGKRFGLKAFKSLGASYAVYRILKDRSGGSLRPEEFLTDRGLSLAGDATFCCATDGNHGRAVAWIAKLLERPAVVFMPLGTVPARIAAIESEGAEVIVVKGGYDEAVRNAAERGKEKDVVVVADVGYPGYLQIPQYIQDGYLTIFQETSIQLKKRGEEAPDILFIQSGVGALAAAAALFFPDAEKGPALVSVEPTGSACLLHSAEMSDDNPHSVESGGQTIMAGLNCETPSLTAWPPIRDRFNAFISIDDTFAVEAMRLLAREGIVSGESGAAGLAALLAIQRERPDLMGKYLFIKSDSRILLINTESDTDPEGYERIVEKCSAEV